MTPGPKSFRGVEHSIFFAVLEFQKAQCLCRTFANEQLFVINCVNLVDDINIMLTLADLFTRADIGSGTPATACKTLQSGLEKSQRQPRFFKPC